MSRFYEYDEYDPLAFGRWKGRLQSHINGPAGQAMLGELRDALLALPQKRLIRDALVDADGECCVVGALALKRKREGRDVDYPIGECTDGDTTDVGESCGMTYVLAYSIAYINDEAPGHPEHRFEQVMKWINNHIKTDPNQRIKVDWGN